MPSRSVLQDWVMELPLREQGVLVAGIRGCDLAPKHPESRFDMIERLSEDRIANNTVVS